MVCVVFFYLANWSVVNLRGFCAVLLLLLLLCLCEENSCLNVMVTLTIQFLLYTNKGSLHSQVACLR